MNWLECKIYTTHYGVEIVTGLLINVGINGMQIEDEHDFQEFIENKTWDYADEDFLNRKIPESIVTFYIEDSIYGNETFISVKNSMHNQTELVNARIEIRNINENEWVNNWKKYYKPFKINNIVIKPQWEDYTKSKEEIVFTIEPGNAFGTGLHHTTALCIGEIENYVNSNTEVLDLGCGSGILSVISLLCGAKEATAIDIEDIAIKSARNNAYLNKVNNLYQGICGNVLDDEELVNNISSKKYNLIFANIIADVIIPITPLVENLISDDGIYITSGIIDHRVEDVKNVLNKKFRIIKHVEKEGWHMFVARKE
ncbi:MAG: 50S ribosomal protein L11 methyltransferase [Lachnospirales bacterium]